MDSSAQNTSGLLRSKKYALYWVSSLLSNIGTWMQQVAQPWVILSITGSSFYVGLDNFVMNAPSWIFTLWGGVIADRFDRKKIVLLCQTIQFFCVLFLLLALITGHLQVWLILITSFLIGMTDALSMPAFMSIVPSLVTDEELPRAVALNSVQFNLSRILGPAVAGSVIAAWGAVVCYGANLISFVPFFLSLYWIYPKNSPRSKAVAEIGTSVHFSEFFDILKDKKFLLPLVTIFSSTLFCSPLSTFASVVIKDVFNGDASEVGQTMAAFGIGGVLGAALFISVAKYFNSVKAVNGLALLTGLAIALAFIIPSLIWIKIVMALVGAGMAMVGTLINSILQKTAENHYRGRIVSLFQLCLHGGVGLGSLFLGLTSAWLGIQHALVLNGIAAILVQIFIFTKCN